MVASIGRVPEAGAGEDGVSGNSRVAGVPASVRAAGTAGTAASPVDGAFEQILRQRLAPVAPPHPPEAEHAARVRFSAHAQERLAQVSVQLGPHALSRLEAAVERAGMKGGKESLILLDDLAFVVSVKNRTVITAVGADRMTDNVFTRIDSVVIAGKGNTAPATHDEDATDAA